MLIVSAIDSIRTLPTTALLGGSLVFFCLVAALFFLIPIALISAEFASRHQEEGGVFHWVRHVFGNRVGAVAVWMQWINTMVWYPTMLLFVGGTAAHFINPAYASNKSFLLITALVTFWGLTLLNLQGIQVSSRVNAFAGLTGTLLPMSLLVSLGFWWAWSGHPLAISFAWDNLLPSFDWTKNSNALVTVMASLLGMELAGVHISDIQNPQINFPKAIGYAVLILLTTLILGALAIAIVIPPQEIHFVDGIMQIFTAFLTAFGVPYLGPVLAFLIMIGSIGGSINWLLSPAKGLLQIAEQGFLPPALLKKNKHGVPVRILMLQAILVTLFCLFIELIPNINGYYWFLMALSTGLYMVMYGLLFLAALKLKRPAQGYQIPRGMRSFSCLAGICACTLTVIVGLQPAPDLAIQNQTGYTLLIVGGFLTMLAPAFGLWLYQKRFLKRKALS